jgi:nitrite reductase/ring-hydroxylating ferredoxin subunit
MCATHGAVYAPDSGHCLGGPCKGGKLRTIAVEEIDDQLYWRPDAIIQPPA